MNSSITVIDHRWFSLRMMVLIPCPKPSSSTICHRQPSTPEWSQGFFASWIRTNVNPRLFCPSPRTIPPGTTKECKGFLLSTELFFFGWGKRLIGVHTMNHGQRQWFNIIHCYPLWITAEVLSKTSMIHDQPLRNRLQTPLLSIIHNPPALSLKNRYYPAMYYPFPTQDPFKNTSYAIHLIHWFPPLSNHNYPFLTMQIWFPP